MQDQREQEGNFGTGTPLAGLKTQDVGTVKIVEAD
jgi:hypothetical protein